ncbi:MAG TPA: TIGR03086 family metal-binding protein [Stackebrandtia sp.]|jgi:uncharacterized protein (TIGR03086 family)|uniref:TIGR03086 family metal-binding protein n=1 Tax=Stackebrandtia sp. TaxID=2023065 RepID=UPI002D40DF03|nr:TIGR03086 family metal-binding protein [Stackebrandtia sp.]HZE40329.1 TIGR03086 family metal-binding protein [Stackebrandtia sp.]
MDHRSSLRRSQLELGRHISTLTDAQLDLTTPCQDWTVRDLLRHVTSNGYALAAAFADEKYDADTDPRLDGDLRVCFMEAADLAWSHASQESNLERLMEFAGADRPGWFRVSFQFLDGFVHIWDLGKAIGADLPLDADLVEQCFTIAELIPDDSSVRGPGKPFGEKVSVPADSPAADRLIGFSGRSPSWSAPSSN